jgi:hypothetical protein
VFIGGNLDGHLGLGMEPLSKQALASLSIFAD